MECWSIGVVRGRRGKEDWLMGGDPGTIELGGGKKVIRKKKGTKMENVAAKYHAGKGKFCGKKGGEPILVVP